MRRDDDSTRFTSKLGMWERDLHTGAVRWGGDVDDILGLRRDRGGPSLAAMLEVIVPEERDEVEAALESSIDDSFGPQRVEYRCRRPDGREVVIRNEWSLGADEAGRPVIRGVILDVTPRKRDKATLRFQAALLEMLYDVAACANEAQTLEQVLHPALERICTLCGWPVGHVLLVTDGEPRELVPAGVWYADDPLRFEALRAAMGRARHGAAMATAGRVMREGEPVWTEDIGRHSPQPTLAAAMAVGLQAAFDLPVLVGAETVAVIECFSLDGRAPDHELTQAMIHVAAQIGRVFERTKVERLKDEFVSVVSHELRTPLTSIQGAIGLLESGVLGPLSTEGTEMARIARDGCGRLLRLVNELLDIQKLESGAPTLHPQRLPLGPILEEAVAASRPYAAALGIRLDLDDRAPGALVMADSDRLSQVVSNLLSNAIKYTPEGERVLCTATRGPGGVRVTVDDRGPGVPQAFRRNLFQKFSQADASDARQKAGTGLGLAICKVIVERLGGTIAHQPIAGGGARFYFELPEISS